MKIFSWMHTKLYGGQEKQKPRLNSPNSVQCTLPLDNRKEEFSDWPETLLAIGTFGYKKEKEDPATKQDNSRSPQNDVMIKETKELTKTLPEKGGAEKPFNQSSDGLLNRTPSSEEVKLKNGDELSPDSQIVLNKAKDLLVDNRGGIRERSLSFLLKKMFICHSGFAPTPSLKDPFTETRTDKILRTLFHKKIYPQNTIQPLAKKMLKKQTSRKKFLEVKTDEHDDRSKWARTDSEYIVLEI